MNAKLRKALENSNELIEELALMGECGEYVKEQLEENKAALAKPLRNCDVFTSESEMKAAFIAYYNEMWDLKGTSYEIDYCDLKHNVEGILHDYIKWLLAPAKA
jgi:GH35 family endo-1,4-beta-xylanase